MSQPHLSPNSVSRVDHPFQHVTPVEVGGVTHVPSEPQRPRALEAANLQPQPQVMPAQAPVRYGRCGADVLFTRTPDGIDFLRVCARHAWAGVLTPTVAQVCPVCQAETWAATGRHRYTELLAAIAANRICIR